MTTVKVDAAIDEGEKGDFYRWPAPWLVDVHLVGDTTHFGPDYVITRQLDEGAFRCALLDATLGFKSFF